MNLGTEGSYSHAALLWTLALVIAGSVVLAPLVEETYFRGFLLPRMPDMFGRTAPVVHAALFASYHLWTPWLAPVRFIAILPLVVVVRRTGSIRIGMAAHMALNAVDAVVIATLATRYSLLANEPQGNTTTRETMVAGANQRPIGSGYKS